jgi:hypothetical protein
MSGNFQRVTAFLHDFQGKQIRLDNPEGDVGSFESSGQRPVFFFADIFNAAIQT